MNARLLDRVATENSGSTEYVRPNENIESAVAKFYGKMTSPVLTNLKIELAGAETNRIYPRDLPDLFAGGQIVVSGRYHASGAPTIRIRGRVGDQEHVFEFPGSLVAHSGDDTYSFVEKLWASRRIGEILSDLDLKGRNQELIDELVRLSTKHGILTPYTAFLADERTRLHAEAWKENADRVGWNVFENDASSVRAQPDREKGRGAARDEEGTANAGASGAGDAGDHRL